jgi:hypothetical protein
MTGGRVSISGVLAGGGACFLAIALIGLLSHIFPYRPLFPIIWGVAATIFLYEAWIFRRLEAKRRSRLISTDATAMSRTAESWPDVKHRFLKAGLMTLLAFTALGFVVGYFAEGTGTAIQLGAIFCLVGLSAFGVVYRVGRRQSANRS